MIHGKWVNCAAFRIHRSFFNSFIHAELFALLALQDEGVSQFGLSTKADVLGRLHDQCYRPFGVFELPGDGVQSL